MHTVSFNLINLIEKQNPEDIARLFNVMRNLIDIGMITQAHSEDYRWEMVAENIKAEIHWDSHLMIMSENDYLLFVLKWS